MSYRMSSEDLGNASSLTQVLPTLDLNLSSLG